ncbi:MAG: hypothetical protein KC643_33325 [Nitrospira sp.]|nr:hypothetical protein [Nitrospira sp.]MCA9470304.1 hypothetical protein [Nitrospira sp.]
MRISGSRVAFQTVSKFADNYSDYPNEHRQSTLYNWWKEEARKFGPIGEMALEAKGKIDKYQNELTQFIEDLPAIEQQNYRNVLKDCAGLMHDIGNLTSAVNRSSQILESERIPESLKRFDGWFELFLKSQNIRWIVLDFLLPIVLGIFALILLLCKH